MENAIIALVPMFLMMVVLYVGLYVALQKLTRRVGELESQITRAKRDLGLLHQTAAEHNDRIDKASTIAEAARGRYQDVFGALFRFEKEGDDQDQAILDLRDRLNALAAKFGYAWKTEKTIADWGLKDKGKED